MKKRVSSIDNWALVATLLIAIFVQAIQYRLGAPQKWHAALALTLVPFSMMVVTLYRYWSSWRFWVALGICLVLHLLTIWVIFAKVLSNVERLGLLYVLPFQLIETVALLLAVGKLMRKLGHQAKYIRI
jgi:hypothetical protein